MSSNMQIVKICEYCTKEFIAKKTTTKCCSDDCAKRFYKLNKRNDKISQAELKTEIKRQPKAFVTEEEIKAVQAKINAVLDGEVIILNEAGCSDFSSLIGGENDCLVYYVFDILWYDGCNLMDLPLEKRRRILKLILPQDDCIRYSEFGTW